MKSITVEEAKTVLKAQGISMTLMNDRISQQHAYIIAVILNHIDYLEKENVKLNKEKLITIGKK